MHQIVDGFTIFGMDGFVVFQCLPQLTKAHPMEDLALSLPLKPGFVAISFRHVALRGKSGPRSIEGAAITDPSSHEAIGPSGRVACFGGR